VGDEGLGLGLGGNALLLQVPWYWPRTALVGSRGFIAWNTFAFSATSPSGSSDVGGSIATKPSTWKRCVTTMSRNAPVPS
jgi:hypothetical protein